MSKTTEIENNIQKIFNESTDRRTKTKELMENNFWGRGSWDKEKQEIWIYLNPKEDDFTGKFILLINWEISRYKIYVLKKQMKFYQEENQNELEM